MLSLGMDSISRTDAPPTLVELQPQLGTPIGKRLRVLQSDGQCAVFFGDTVIHLYDAHDSGARAATIALLARARVTTDSELGEMFDCHRNTVGRIERRFEEGGMAGVVPAKRGPKGPHKVTPAVMEVIKELPNLSSGELTRAIKQRTGIRLNRTYVSSLIKKVRETEQPQLWPAVEPESVVEELVVRPEPVLETREPPVALPGEPRRIRYLGAALYYPALQALGLLEAAASCFRFPGVRRFGVRAVMLTLFFLSLSGETTVEAAKHLRRWEFGPLVGVGRAPAVKTLRRKLGALIKQGQATHFGEILVRRWVERGLVATAYLYVDGHVKAYTGKRKLAECWNAQRRMPLPGLLSYFVNDQEGRPLLFVTEEADASLAEAMPKLVAAIRQVLKTPFTVIFDRGGYDGKLFAWLKREQIDFITYQRGEPGLPVAQFRRREYRFEGRRVRMQLAEDQIRVGGSGPWRRIVVRTKTGHQTAILTSLANVASAKIACLMFARWRQENFFKYSKEHHGLDQLLGYAWAEADGARLVPNPERKLVERELKARRQELAQQKAAMGQVLLDEPRNSGHTGHGIKIAQRGTVGELRALEKEIARLENRRAETPKRISLAEAGPRAVLRLEQKAIVDRVKMTAYNAEEWLLDLLVCHYPNKHDVRALLRSFAQLAGEIRTTPAGVLITFDPPDLPLQREALRGLCADLNQLSATFPGTEIPVSYAVAMHHSEAVP